MSNYSEIEQYYLGLITSCPKVSMNEFFHMIHQHFYNDYEIGFMDYFLDIIKYNNLRVISHKKLIEYGVVTSDKSYDVLNRLEDLNVKNSEQYYCEFKDLKENEKRVISSLRNIPQQNNNTKGGQNKLIYYLTPKCFKLCLMRAKKHKTQSINVIMYAEYYLLLEEMFNYFNAYEKAHKDFIIGYEEFTERALTAILSNELSQNRFQELMELFKSFEGKNHKFCINFTGAWLKYALDGEYNKTKMNFTNIKNNILGKEFVQKPRCMMPCTRN